MEQSKPDLRTGQHVIYVDPVARQHDAIITAVWGPTCINIVFAAIDESKTDSYGRQIERQTSLSQHPATTPLFPAQHCSAQTHRPTHRDQVARL